MKHIRDEGVKKEDVEGKIILIGLDVKASPDMTSSQKDSFPSPFTRFDAQSMPGVELHANLISNLINKNSVSYKSNIFNMVLLSLNFIMVSWICSSWKPISSLLYGVVSSLLIRIRPLFETYLFFLSNWYGIIRNIKFLIDLSILDDVSNSGKNPFLTNVLKK